MEEHVSDALLFDRLSISHMSPRSWFCALHPGSSNNQPLRLGFTGSCIQDNGVTFSRPGCTPVCSYLFREEMTKNSSCCLFVPGGLQDRTENERFSN